MMPGKLSELMAVLHGVIPLLDRGVDLAQAQREAVCRQDLAQVLALTVDQEALNARLARQERQRQAIQAQLETALGVVGLGEIGQRALPEGPERRAYFELVAAVGRAVRRLQHENAQTTAALAGAITLTHQLHQYLTRLQGSATAYCLPAGPVGTPVGDPG